MGAFVSRRVLAAIAVVVMVAVTLTSVAVREGRSDPASRSAAPTVNDSRAELDSEAYQASTHFLDTYVDEGRVSRTDQGGDTVSEGQAYGMLVALAIGDAVRFDNIWSWTKANLERPDGLLSWRWHDGQVVEKAAASDADVLAAWALLLAGDRFNSPEYRTAGQQLASAVLDQETVKVGGLPVLVAGPWATRSSPSFVVPGYFAPPVFASLADLTGDKRWDDLVATSRDVTAQLHSGEAQLVPDWAKIDSEGGAAAHGAPGSGSEEGSYSLDAARLYVWLAMSCDDQDRALAAPRWSLFEQEKQWGVAMIYGLDGSRQTDNQHPLTWVAAASTARAAGSDADVDDLLEAAAQLDGKYPSYYGAGWVALGRILLTTDWLHSC